MTILLSLIGMLVCFYLLAIVCDEYFVDSLEQIAARFKLNDDVAGATLMAIGSSAPELFTAMIALTKAGAENVGAGTIVGSAIFNILVIIGVSAYVAKSQLSWRPVLRDLLVYVLSILVLLYTFKDGVITRSEAVVYVAIYALYILLLSQWSKWFRDPERAENPADGPEEEEPESKGILSRAIGLLFPKREKYGWVFLISILLIGVLSWVLVELAVNLATALGIPNVIIALTILAAGTSVPDMLSSVIVARQGKGGMAVSNAVGSNSFDILVGLGLPWLVYILVMQKNVVVSTENLYSSIMLLFFTVVALLFLLIAQQFRIGRRSGFVLLVLYAGYLVYAVITAYSTEELALERWMDQIVQRF